MLLTYDMYAQETVFMCDGSPWAYISYMICRIPEFRRKLVGSDGGGGGRGERACDCLQPMPLVPPTPPLPPPTRTLGLWQPMIVTIFFAIVKQTASHPLSTHASGE
jgi:hypothetical protein